MHGWKNRPHSASLGLACPPLLVGAASFFLAALQPASSTAFLKPDEQVVLYPTFGWRVENGWRVEIHGRVFESGKSPVMQHALGINEAELSPDERDIFVSRARLFFDDSERGKQINVAFRDQSYKLPRSQANGHFDGSIRIAESAVGLPGGDSHSITFSVIHSNALVRPGPGESYLLNSSGLSVISNGSKHFVPSVQTSARHGATLSVLENECRGPISLRVRQSVAALSTAI
jgi:hypothetical protein